MRVVVVGSGGHGAVVLDALLRMRDAGADMVPVGIVSRRDHGSEILGVRVLGDHDALETVEHDAVVLAIGDNRTRCRVAQELSQSAFCSVVHPAAVVAPDVEIGPGAVVLAGAVVNTGTRLGVHCILNTGCTVDHDCEIGPFCHVAPGVHLAGNVRLEQGAFMGIGSCAVPGVRVGQWAVAGAGAAVVADVADHATVTGVPARTTSQS